MRIFLKHFCSECEQTRSPVLATFLLFPYIEYGKVYEWIHHLDTIPGINKGSKNK